MIRKYKKLLFDLDNTLVDDDENRKYAFEKILVQRKEQVTNEKLEKFIQLDNQYWKDRAEGKIKDLYKFKNLEEKTTWVRAQRFIMYFNYQTVNEILSNTEYENNYDVDTLKDNKFPNKGLVNEEVTIHDSNSNWNKDADNMFTKEGASEEQTQDPNNIILEHDPEYCKGCEHEKVDPDTVLYKNKVIVNAMDSSWKKPSDEIYMKEHVPPEEVGKDDTFIIEQDEDYCGGKDHGKVDPDTVLYNNRMMIHSNDGSWKKVSEDTYLEGHVPPNVDKENTYVMNPDNDYCGDTGIDISEISIAGLDDESSITNADIHNSKVVEPPKISTKKFSSSAN